MMRTSPGTSTARATRIAAAALAVGLAAAPARPPKAPPTTTLALDRSNVSELEGSALEVVSEPVDGNTRVTIAPLVAWPVANAFLGLDRISYGADARAHPIIRIQDEDCDQIVVDGAACGWNVNRGSCSADGFGCFASLTSDNARSAAARTAPFVVYMAGKTSLGANDRGSRIAVHARFSGSSECSGWLSDGNPRAVAPQPGCIPALPPPNWAAR